ncbi:MAG: heme-binding domain-containing protein [Lewinellaceae bacterium]|nr:heme-binding domain-containing protein [Lewinellaceae bacterium]
MKKIWWLAPIIILLGIQLIPGNISNPPFDPVQDVAVVTAVPAEVQTILKAACYDCHSNEVKSPWYAHVAPVSWWIGNHIIEGREALNFSTFGALQPKDRSEAMEEAAEKVREGEMPLNSYVWIHSEARLSQAQRNTLLSWLDSQNAEAGGRNGESGEEDQEEKD